MEIEEISMKGKYTLSEINKILDERKQFWVNQEYGGGKTTIDFLIRFAIVDLREKTLRIEGLTDEPDRGLRGDFLFVLRLFEIIRVFQEHCSDTPNEVP